MGKYQELAACSGVLTLIPLSLCIAVFHKMSIACISQTCVRQYRLKQSILDELPKVRTTVKNLHILMISL
jgi:hypothetical protein